MPSKKQQGQKKVHSHVIMWILLCLIGQVMYVPPVYSQGRDDWESVRKGFENPPDDCWPHTRWWWPGNPVSKESITWQLAQMRSHGITGVEQITMGPLFEKGNIPFMSDEFIKMLTYMVREAERLKMEVSINFGGPGWIIGGDWVPENERSKDIVPTSVIVKGPEIYNGRLPMDLTRTERSWEIPQTRLSGEENLLAVVAGKLEDGELKYGSFQLLTDKVSDGNINWAVPAGTWRLMAFWLKRNGDEPAVDHFSENAMRRYCDFFGGKLYAAFGDAFGKTVESMFIDSFELPNSASGIYWSDDLLEKFKRQMGYDLTSYLPAIWWTVDDISPKIRYDVNRFLHQTGIDVFFKTFLDWCQEHGVQGRIQPYGFTTDNIQAAGVTHIPEMEITPGEKDQHPWYDTRIGPKKYVASGAHIYGRPVVSAEVYTFMHWERYRATLEELKIASDGYLRAGATRFYNHGYSFTPEKQIAPTRAIGFAANISHTNVWWPYYPLLASYVARSSFMLRQGDFIADVAIYSPLANQWTHNVLNARKWTREFDWGELGNLILSNGYDFDLVNDDALQNLARVDDGKLNVGAMTYRVLLLPNIEAVPLKTLQLIESYVKAGGQVIALDRLPATSTGFKDNGANDRAVREIISRMFDGTGEKKYGLGKSFFIPGVIYRLIWWDQYASVFDPFLNTLRKVVDPDFAIDFAREGLRHNAGLSFMHRKAGERDIYFITNIQDRASEIPVTFRVKTKHPWQWNPYTGDRRQLHHYRETDSGIQVPLKLAPYESTFIVFEAGQPVHVTHTGFADIVQMTEDSIIAEAGSNGTYQVRLSGQDGKSATAVLIDDIPSSYRLEGNWQMKLFQKEAVILDTVMADLFSWTDLTKTRNVSGTGIYNTEFQLPESCLKKNICIRMDVGKCANIADVSVNGQHAGVIWMRGQLLDITRFINTGKNLLQINVTNTDINAVSGMSKPAPLTDDLRDQFGSEKKGTEISLPREFGFKPLPPSGLLGPVELNFSKQVHLQLGQ